MSNRIHELLHRNLQEVFGEGDATRRRAAIAELYTKDCELYVPPGKFHPSTQAWILIIVRDGKIATLYVFLDSMPQGSISTSQPDNENEGKFQTDGRSDQKWLIPFEDSGVENQVTKP